MMTSFWSKAAPVSALALLLLSGTAIRGVVGNVPAFQPDLNITAITGRAQLSNTRDMYDHGAYLFQIAYGYLNAEVLLFGNLEPADEIASLETAQTRLEKARDLSRRSLQLDPANAHAWQVHAMSSLAVGTLEEAEAALQRSWELAPTTYRLSLSRIHMIEALRELRQDPEAHADIYAADLRVLARNAPRLLPG